jgi:uncharacterized membrane-anchored protein
LIGRLRRRSRQLLGGPPPAQGVVSGIARVDQRTKRLLPRLQPGDIAVIDHEDIDRVSAEGLIQRQVGAVVNAAPSSSGRYPNLGPLLLCSAGIPLLDCAGPEVMGLVEGTRVIVEGDRVLRVLEGDTAEIARGRLLELAQVEREIDVLKQSIALEIERFAENTIEYVKEERDVLLEALRLPDVSLDFHGRHVLIVVRGYDYKDDLLALRSYIRELKPILIGVDGGADALVEASLTPDLIIGDMDSVTTRTLLSGAELVVHAYAGGKAPGLDRLNALGLANVVFEAPGTSEDIAMLLAYERGAELIVAVGTHTNLIEFMDKGRKGMASTFLTRLRVGPILVDAKGVNRLYRTQVRKSDLVLLSAVAVATLAIAVALSEPLRLYVGLLWIQAQALWSSIVAAVVG